MAQGSSSRTVKSTSQSRLVGPAGVGVHHLQYSLPSTMQQLSIAAGIECLPVQSREHGGQQGPLASSVQTRVARSFGRAGGGWEGHLPGPERNAGN